ncbi:MAG TPA: sulfatase-like hydrolase/transferase [Solirubrobacteraceae bacterium]|nr:sulfatase-like hydrolase/transferase [Solirubrobacteraceae bacterium]
MGGGKEKRVTRRTLIKRGLIAGGAIAAGGGIAGGLLAGESERVKRSAPKRISIPPPPQRPPNILVVIVDQLRAPQWFQNEAAAAGLMPNLARLRRGGVYFSSHYTAANDCTPARSVLLTGLYSQQTGCLITSGSTLSPRFQTWGSMLRDQGYETWYYGKWHLTQGDNLWTEADRGALEPYGFSGGTYPSPDGSPGQGWRVDPQIAEQFRRWYARAPQRRPWCTTVSFVNPHDIEWWYRWSDQVPAERSAPRIVSALPPNFETPASLEAQRKPRLQLSFQGTSQVSFGRVPYSGPRMARAWLPFMDLYLKLCRRVDQQIGAVLDTLLSRPQIAANTVIVFTSDHGEYGASHGMRGKGAAAYDEALRVPLIVKDMRGLLAAAPAQPRTGLTSSADFAPMLLSIATGSGAWRQEPRYAHIASRHDLAAMLGDPTAPGRPYILHSTDEIVTEFAIELYAAEAPLHVTAIRTPHAKYALYSNWAPHTDRIEASGQESELYDYRTLGGRLEIENVAGASDLEPMLREQLEAAIRNELRESLPSYLQSAQQAGYANYYDKARQAAVEATVLRRKIERREGRPRVADKLGAQ